MQEDGLLLQYASKIMKDDPVIVGAATTQNPEAFLFASPRIQQLYSIL